MEENQPLIHLGIIADGNRRWARDHNLPTLEGHKKGLDVVGDLVDAVIKHAEVKFLSFFVFSTENWNRSKDEVGYLMNLALTKVLGYAEKLKDRNAKMIILGIRDHLDEKLIKKIEQAEEKTKDCDGLTVCFCFNYGGKQEIADAATKILEKRLAKGEEKEEIKKITPEEIEENLYHPEVPACDLIVRTSGEERISGFMLWRASYSEFYFEPKYFPELTKTDADHFLEIFHERKRRFGK